NQKAALSGQAGGKACAGGMLDRKRMPHRTSAVHAIDQHSAALNRICERKCALRAIWTPPATNAGINTIAISCLVYCGSHRRLAYTAAIHMKATEACPLGKQRPEPG